MNISTWWSMVPARTTANFLSAVRIVRSGGRGSFSIFASMDINCTERELFVFKKIAHAAKELHMPVYLIGGFVRDKLIGRKTKDADIVCIGSGIELAHRTAALFNPSPSVAFF